MQLLLPSGVYHGMATHDPKMILPHSLRGGPESFKDQFEFQMLYGVRMDLQRQLVRDGFRVRIYIPYGRDWFPISCGGWRSGPQIWRSSRAISFAKLRRTQLKQVRVIGLAARRRWLDRRSPLFRGAIHRASR
jgi:hypothetical protein